MGGIISDVDPTPPQVDPTPPQVDPTPPQVEPTTPQVEPTTPQVEPTPPQVDPTTPQVDPTPPQVDPTTSSSYIDPRYDFDRPDFGIRDGYDKLDGYYPWSDDERDDYSARDYTACDKECGYCGNCDY